MATFSAGFGPFSFSGYDPFMSFAEGGVNSFFDKKSEKRAYERQLALMEAQYSYAQRYAENSPSWNVRGLRAAGLNPILAVSNGVNLGATIPSAPSVTSHKPTPSSSQGGFRYDPLISSQIRVNEAQIENLNQQGEAALINAKANMSKSEASIRLSDAETALKTLEKARYETGANADNPAIRDAHRTLNHVLDSASSSWDYIKDTFSRPYIPTKGSRLFDSFINYIQHGPKTTDVDKKVHDRLESLLDDLSEALPFRGFRHHLKGTSKRVRQLINTR